MNISATCASRRCISLLNVPGYRSSDLFHRQYSGLQQGQEKNANVPLLRSSSHAEIIPTSLAFHENMRL